MGWADCGEDSTGRPIGYAHEATCDRPRCRVLIDRGLAHACGEQHGAGADFCERYFCEAHLRSTDDGTRCDSCHRSNAARRAHEQRSA